MGSLRQITRLSENGVRIFCKQMKDAENASILLRINGIRTGSGLRTAATKADVDENIKKFKEGNFEKIPDPNHLDHFRKSQSTETLVESLKDPPPMGTHTLPHPIWSEEELHNVKVTHKPPEGFVDKLAFRSVKLLRSTFDLLTGFNWGERSEKKWVLRICFLETVAGVPGMVAAMTRHLHSLRRLKRDHGWIHTLLEEAENERMHLMTALQLRQPSWLFRMGVIVSQGAFVTMFSGAYLLSPRFCHRFVGYLEEEAVFTYSKCLKDIESGPLKHWQTLKAPDVAIRYWKLPGPATMKDVIFNIRADEANHRKVNHVLASLPTDKYNPFLPGQ
ncbi:uncharacterized protein LOC111119097 isoform X1 [Crassostrea virginica]